MSQIHTLSDIDEGNKLGNFLHTKLENHLSQANQDYKTAIDYSNQIADYNKLLLDKCSSQVKSFNWEKKTWDLEKKDLNWELTQYYNEIDKLQKENTNLISQITEKELSFSKLKSKLKKNSEKKDSEIISLNSKLSELEHIKNELIKKNDKLERQKSDILTASNRKIYLRKFLRKNNGQSLNSLSYIKSPEQQDFTSQNDISQKIKEANTFSNVENKSLLQSNDCVSHPEINVFPNLVQQRIPNASSDKSNFQISMPQRDVPYISGGIEWAEPRVEDSSIPIATRIFEPTSPSSIYSDEEIITCTMGDVIKDYDTEEFIEYLRRKDLKLNNDDFAIFHNEKIDGLSFLELIREDFTNFGFKGDLFFD
ncbi:hypothetical protein Glove_212g99 [Diversispora epigaea]|uniref:SAM domain-containing protein n=1 Tax=Diversispora epigaea TaxID=1348612 RepID=A0A397IPH9_9GLOM|nr:hypothetical protein Glove_212g99 [Diversispora epigaea]